MKELANKVITSVRQRRLCFTDGNSSNICSAWAVRVVVEEGWTGHCHHSSNKTISLVSNSTAGANVAICNNDLLTIITVTLDFISLLWAKICPWLTFPEAFLMWVLCCQRLQNYDKMSYKSYQAGVPLSECI